MLGLIRSESDASGKGEVDSPKARLLPRSLPSDFSLSPDFRITLMELYKSAPPSLPLRRPPSSHHGRFSNRLRPRRPPPPWPRKPTCYAPPRRGLREGDQVRRTKERSADRTHLSLSPSPHYITYFRPSHDSFHPSAPP